MDTNDIKKLRKLTSFEALVDYLRDELDWPIEDAEKTYKITFEYSPSELGLDEKSAVKIRDIRQLRPLVDDQPWGIFWIDFEPKRLPITVMRRILNQLVTKKRGGKSHQATWNSDDLLFISAVGDEKTDQREMTFAHFHQEQGDLPTLRVLGWDGADTVLKIDYVSQTLKEKLRWPKETSDVKNWREQWASAFRHKPGHVIKTADALAERLAELARRIRAAAQTIMEHETEKGRLRKLYKAFQTALIHDLSEEDFADTYAQTITYGLLTAAFSRTDLTGGRLGTALVAENITDMVPVTNPFLREMLKTFLNVGGRKGGIDFDELGIQDVVDLLRSDETDLPEVIRDFNNRAKDEDPVIRFYEDFLSAYNKKLKIQRGVFYTPKPVVSYIVRGVHELLQTEFGLEDGLAATVTWGEMRARNTDIEIPKGVSPNSFFVMILDPATGTATFLVEVIDVIYKTMVARWKKQGYKNAQIQAAWNEYVPTSLLPRLYGYELMMAPYAIAHMKIGLKLFETGYRFASDQRANIYLTNALEEPSQLAQGSAASLFEALGHESQAVNDVKRDVHFTVVIGNPPYSRDSANRGEYAESLVKIYKKEVRSERNIQPLSDDYVKFFALSQHLISESGVGICGLITNHSFIHGVIHRGLRSQIYQYFSNCYFIDLHGNSNIQEQAPIGVIDGNVFNIQQGVAISLLIRAIKQQEDSHQVSVSELWGNSNFKNDWLSRHVISDTTWISVKLRGPDYWLFISGDGSIQSEFDSFPHLQDWFPVSATGFITHRDDLVIDIDKGTLLTRIQDLANLSISDEEIVNKYSLSENGDWSISSARNRLQAVKDLDKRIILCTYRPFDNRWCWWGRELMDRPRPELAKFFSIPNTTLLCKRQNKKTPFSYSFVTNVITESCTFESAHANNVAFPMFIPSNDFLISKGGRRPNVGGKILNFLESHLGLVLISDEIGDLRKTCSPVDLLNYAYAVLHSPGYRTRYEKCLIMSFPRLPLTSNVELFRQLCGLGKELVALHLLESPIFESRESGIGKSVRLGSANDSRKTNPDSRTIAKGYPKYQDGKVYINTESAFEGVPEDVWEFHIGGYQVCEKWLKDRRERELSAEDIVHYGKVVVSLRETIRLMGEVDGVIESAGGWPIK